MSLTDLGGAKAAAFARPRVQASDTLRGIVELTRALGVASNAEEICTHVGSAAHDIALAEWTTLLRTDDGGWFPALTVTGTGRLRSLIETPHLNDADLAALDGMAAAIGDGDCLVVGLDAPEASPPSWRDRLGAGACVLIPMRRRGHLVGLIATCVTRGTVSSDGLEALQLVAALGASALGLVDEVSGEDRRVSRRTVAANDVASVRASADTVSAASVVARAMVELSGARSFRVMVVDGTAVRVVASYDDVVSVGDWFSLGAEPRLEDALRCANGRPVLLEDLGPSSLFERANDDGGSTVALVVPLGEADRTQGAVWLELPSDVDREAVVEDCALLARSSWLALSRALIVDELRLRLKFVETLRQLSEQVSARPDLPMLLHDLNELARDAVGVQLLEILLTNRQTAKVFNARTPRGELAKVVRTWRKKSPVVETAGAELAVPVVVDAELVGVVRVLPMSASADAPRLRLLLAEAAAELGSVLVRAALRLQMSDATRQLTRVEERERIASELHHRVGALLSRIGSETASDKARADTAKLAHAAQVALDEALSALTASSSRLTTLPARLRQLALEVPLSAQLDIDVRVLGRGRRLNRRIEATLFDFARVALMTLQRHARASSVLVRLSYREDSVRLTVRDNGRALESRPLDGEAIHTTLRKLQLALEQVGGHLQPHSSHAGMALDAIVPITVDGEPTGASGSGRAGRVRR